MASRREGDKEYLKKAYAQHKGEWLTLEAVEGFQKLAKNLKNKDGGQIIKERKELCSRLMVEYGVTEVEAVNIVNGNRVMDYVNKYYRIQNQIELRIEDDKSIKNKEEKLEEDE